MGQLRDDVVKQIGEGEATYALREAWKRLYNDYPSIDSLALLWAQWALETGRGKSIHNFNFGNIKKAYKPDDGHDWCMFRCNEVLPVKQEDGTTAYKTFWFDPPHIQTHFRAYPTAVDGAADYINFLAKKTRYQKAWEQVKKGDPSAFSHELRAAGYYTANEAQYTKGIVSLTNEFKRKAPALLEWRPEPEVVVVVEPPVVVPVEPKPEPKPEEKPVEPTPELTKPVVEEPVAVPPAKQTINSFMVFLQFLIEFFKRFHA